MKNNISEGKFYEEKSIRAVWGIRNLIGHSIGWPDKPTLRDFELMHFSILGSICLNLNSLYL